MVPVRLELKNFMSYGEQVTPLDFSGMHLACLSGDNGNGKSAILDAITWALWGEARAPADELIRLGAQEMRVVFEFRLGDDLYRVIRVRTRKASGNIWEVYVAENTPALEQSPGTHGINWRPITGQGIRDTGKVIERILRMDYKTFINSAYIQQGRADEFTKQTVADRKKILADILDLSRYDALEQKAKERRNDADLKVQELEREIGLYETELANEAEYRRQLAEAQSERESVEKRIAESEQQLRQLQSRQAELESAARRMQDMTRQMSEWRAEVQRLLSRRREQEERIEKSRELIRDKDRILEGQARLSAVQEEISKLDRTLEELRSLEHRRAGLEQQLDSERHKLELQRQSLEKEAAELHSKITAAEDIARSLEPLKKRVAELDQLDTCRAQLQSELNDISDQMGQMRAQRDQLRDQVKPDLENKLAMISGPDAECPLCKTRLDPEKHALVIEDYRRRIAEVDSRIESIVQEGTGLKKRREAIQAEIEKIASELKDGLEIRRQIAQGEQVIFQAEEYRKQLPGIQESLDQVTHAIESGDFAPDIRRQVASIVDRISALQYDESVHQRLRDEAARLESFSALAISLRHAEENLAADESNLQAICDLIEAREKSIVEYDKSIKDLAESLSELDDIRTEVKSVEDSLRSLRESDRSVTGQIATLESAIKRCEALRVQIGEKRTELEKAKKDKAMYSELVAAFGKKGVQALIIENAIPEIQEEANRLLARMTDNAMHVFIETVKDKKTGGTAETLDIRISDDMGTRSYELYSGGEAFRINFALRIALSKLLARRAGARLQTLIIDEGFGTQDGKGREKLIEAIDSIRDDFELILVITHIDELKDAFPTRIEITKDSQGSQISLN